VVCAGTEGLSPSYRTPRALYIESYFRSESTDFSQPLMYRNTHELPDAQDYREKTFLPLMAELAPTMVDWIFPDPNDPPVVIYPKAEHRTSDVKPRVPFMHTKAWVLEDALPFIDKGCW